MVHISIGPSACSLGGGELNPRFFLPSFILVVELVFFLQDYSMKTVEEAIYSTQHKTG